MDLLLVAYYIWRGAGLAIVQLFLLHFYSKHIKPYTAFPNSWLSLKILKHFITEKMPENCTRESYVLNLLVKESRKYEKEGFCVLWLPKPLVLILNEEAVKILSNEPSAFHKADNYEVLKEVIGTGVITSNGNAWKNRRKLMRPVFRASMLKQFGSVIDENTGNVVQQLLTASNQPVEILPFLKKCSVENLIWAMYGVKADIEDSENVLKISDKISDMISDRLVNPLHLMKSFLPQFSKERKFTNAFQIMERKGYSTVAYALTWCLFLLGNHHDVQEQVYEEVKHLTGENVYDGTEKLTYTECVLKETLRLYPVVPIYARCLQKDMQCRKCIIPKGANIVFFPYALQRNPDLYPDPDRFDPERFRGNGDKNPWSYIAYAEGVRSCIGKAFANIQMKIILARILQKFKVASANRIEDVDVGWELVLVPNQPIKLYLTPRSAVG